MSNDPRHMDNRELTAAIANAASVPERAELQAELNRRIRKSVGFTAMVSQPPLRRTRR